RGSFRRWSAQRQRSSLDARWSLWHHDDFRWNRTYFAVSVTGFLFCPLGCCCGGRNRVRLHCLDKEALHGYSAASGHFSGSARRYSRISNRYFDRESLVSWIVSAIMRSMHFGESLDKFW